MYKFILLRGLLNMSIWAVAKYDITPLRSYFIDAIWDKLNGMRDMVIVCSLGSISWMGLMDSGMMG